MDVQQPGGRTARRGTRVGVALALSALSLAPVLAAPAAADGASVTVLVPGLDNPRGITVGPDGQVYVAEAGTGAPGSGKVVALDGSHLRTVAAGLPSATAHENDVTGPTNVAVSPQGKLVATIGAGPQIVDGRYNSLLRLEPGTDKSLADIQSFITAHPDLTDLDQPPNPTDSNPYGVAWVDSTHYLVADAAANRLLMVGPAGSVRAVAKLPNQLVSTAGVPGGFPVPVKPAEAVPTSVAIGPDGFAYVGELKGFPFTPGTSRIWRVSPWAQDVTCDPAATSGPCTVYADGFTAITGLGFGPDGSLYVVSFLKNGLLADGPPVGGLYRLHDGARTELAAGLLTLPGDVAVSRTGTVYVTNLSVSSGGGQVFTVTP